PIQFLKDFGDTAALMLTVASPKVSDLEIRIRAQAIRPAMERVRAQAGGKAGQRATIVLSHPVSIDPREVRRTANLSMPWARAKGFATDIRTFEGPGYYGIDFATTVSDEVIRARVREFIEDRLRESEFHPDSW